MSLTQRHAEDAKEGRESVDGVDDGSVCMTVSV